MKARLGMATKPLTRLMFWQQHLVGAAATAAAAAAA
jgi:hypothetical protein